MAKKAAAKQSSKSSGPRLFEFRDGKSDKFWEIDVSGKSHTVRYGRVGTDGQSKTKDFADAALATADAEKLIAQKTKKGYQEIQNKSAARSVQAVVSKQDLKLHDPFLKAIQKDPDNYDAYGIYADWLSERGDPRGEFIHLQWQLENPKLTGAARQKVVKQEKALLKKHQREWLGDLAEELLDNPHKESGHYSFSKNPYRFTFARGFLDSLSIGYLLPSVASQIASSPATSLLRTLKVANVENGEFLAEEFEEYADKNWEYEDYPSIDALAKGKLENLRELRIDEELGYDTCHMSAPGVHKIVKHSPRIEVLHLAAHEINAKMLFRAPMPALKSLTLLHGWSYPLEILGKNDSLKNLESIHCFPHCKDFDDEEPNITFKGLKGLCQSKSLQSLKHLCLKSTDFGDKGIAELLRSGLIQRLESLELIYGAATDKSVAALAESDLGNLQRLDLTGNYLSATGVKDLKKSLAIQVEAKQQYSGDPADEEKEHLMNGDYE